MKAGELPSAPPLALFIQQRGRSVSRRQVVPKAGRRLRLYNAPAPQTTSIHLRRRRLHRLLHQVGSALLYYLRHVFLLLKQVREVSAGSRPQTAQTDSRRTHEEEGPGPYRRSYGLYPPKRVEESCEGHHGPAARFRRRKKARRNATRDSGLVPVGDLAAF